MVLLSLALWQKYEQTIAASSRTTQNLVRTIEEHALRSFHEANVMLSGLADLFEERSRHGPLDVAEMRKTLSAHVRLSNQYRNLALIDAAGARVASATGDTKPLDVSDRDYFTVLRDHPEIDFYVSRPFFSRIAHVWSLAFSRRLHRPDGSFDGIVVAVVNLSWLQDFYAALDVGQLGNVTLWDGTASHVLARYPVDTSLLGQTFDVGPLFDLVRDGKEAGTFESVSPLDGIDRIVSFRRVADMPFVVSVALAEQETLQNWRRELWTYCGGAAIVSAVLLLLTAALLWQLRRQQQFVAALRASEAATADANRRLQASEARFRDYAETASDWYWETDSEHRFTFISDRIRRFGVDPDARIGSRRIDNALDVADAGKWQAHQADLVRHAPFSDFIYRSAKPGEEARYSSVSGKPLFDDSGKFLGYRGSGRDVTEMIRSEERLREALATAEAANRAKSDFLAGMSHELRTPLNAIIGFSDLVRAGMAGAVSSKIREYVGDIYVSGQHLLKMINDILEISRIEAGAVALNETAIDVGEAIAVCVRLLTPRANEGGLSLDVAICDDLPPLFIDDTRLKQILLNLLSNAVKFTSPGGTVTVRATIEGGAMVIAVADNGIGMSADEIEVAVQPFRQVDSNLARRSEGTGLGLPLTKAFVELHGGRLTIESTPGRGTTASVVFPSDRVLQKAA